MRGVLLAAVFGVAVAAQPVRCTAELLERPGYPPLVRKARIVGAVTALVTVGADGYLTADYSAGANVFFGRAVSEAIASSRLSPANCAGQTIPVLIRFVLNSHPVSDRWAGSTYLGNGEIEIRAIAPPGEYNDCPMPLKRRYFRNVRRLFTPA